MNIFKCDDVMPTEPDSLNEAQVVRTMMTPGESRAQSRAFHPDYSAPSVHNLPCRYGRGKHY